MKTTTIIAITLLSTTVQAGTCIGTGDDTYQCSDGTVIVKDGDTIHYTNSRRFGSSNYGGSTINQPPPTVYQADPDRLNGYTTRRRRMFGGDGGRSDD